MVGVMARSIRNRLGFLRRALTRPWPRRFIFLFALIGAWDTFIAQFLPAEWAEKIPNIYSVLAMTSGYVPWWLWLIGGVVLVALISIEYAYRRYSGFQTDDLPNAKLGTLPDGPVYWEAVEALSWIAVGKPIKSGTWMSDAREQESKPWPDDLSKRFDDAEREFFERIRGGDIKVLGVKDGEHSHARIPPAHFLSPVAIHILHNTVGRDAKSVEDMNEWKGPKYSKLQVKRADVLKLWPDGGSEFVWPNSAATARPEGRPRRDTYLLNAIHFVAFGSWKLRDWEDMGDHIETLYRAVEKLEQASLDGDIPIWGKESASDKYVLINSDLWADFDIKETSLLHGVPERVYARRKRGQGPHARFNALKTNKAKVIEWHTGNISP